MKIVISGQEYEVEEREWVWFPRDPLLRRPNHLRQDEGASNVYERDAGQCGDRDARESLQGVEDLSGGTDCEEDLQTIYVVEDSSGDELNNLAYLSSYLEAHKYMNKVIEFREEADKKFNADSRQHKRWPRKRLHSLDLSVEEVDVYDTSEQVEEELGFGWYY